jgi:hypothetical protein
MSTRANGSGMMAVATTHKSLSDLEKDLMLNNDPAAPNGVSTTGPEPGLVEVAAPEPVKKPVALRRRKAEEEITAMAPVDEMADEFAPRTEVEVLHTRIPRWLAEGLEEKYLEFRRKNRKVTKQTVVTYALIKALGITPPDDFRLL